LKNHSLVRNIFHGPFSLAADGRSAFGRLEARLSFNPPS
jgi:hypothetical protein